MTVNLFQKYGGFGAISKVVMAFYDKVLDSEVTGAYFDAVDMRRLIDHQTKFIASVMGGPASYSDEQLRQIHAQLAISPEAFAEAVTLLQATLREAGFDAADIGEIIGQVRSKEGMIVAGRRG